jgi:DNA-binding NarL/FixJ family response regulator
VASGLTNRQVADRMSMSAHTVEAHLSTIYRALGIRSRGELGAALTKDRVTVRDSAGRSRDTGRS